MRFRSRIVGGFIVLFFCCSCLEQQKRAVINPLYFDLEELIDRQVEKLQSKKSRLRKDFRIESSVESRTVENVRWEQELEVFRTIDINSPVLRETFRVDTINLADRKKVVYKPKKKKDNGVSELTLTFDQSDNLKQVDGRSITDNILYSSEKKLRLDFEGDEANCLLKSYKIDTHERLLFRKSCGNTIKGEIISSSF